MIQIKSLPLIKLRNSEHFQFMSDAKEQIVQLTPVALGLDPVYPTFDSALNVEGNYLRIELGSNKSITLDELDDDRDKTWSGMRSLIKAYLFSPFPDQYESARKLIRIVDLYGNMRHKSYNEESASITNLVAELKNETYRVDVEGLSLNSWVDHLKNTNENFIGLFNERNTELANRENGDVREARVITDEAYEAIVARLNAAFVLDMATPEAESFVLQLNEKISYYKNVLSMRHSRMAK